MIKVALNELPPPDIAHSAFLEGLGHAIDQSRPHWCAPIYALSVADLASAGGDPLPRAVGWYCAATDASGMVAGEVPGVPDAPGGSLPLTTSLSFGSMVSETWRAFAQVMQHPELQAQPFDLRWLRIAGLGIDAFWLKAAGPAQCLGGDDRVYAFLAYQAELKNQLLSASDFLKIVRNLAAASLLFDNSPARP